MTAALTEAGAQNPELMLNRVLEIPDIIPSKPQLLHWVGGMFLARFHRTRSRNDIDNCILAYDLATQLLPVDDAKFMDFLHDSGTSFFERYNLTGNLADINQATSKLEIVVKGMVNDHGPHPGWLNNLGISFTQQFERTGDLTDISKAISLRSEERRVGKECVP